MSATTQPPSPSTRDKLIEVARELIYLQGYEATSVAEILEKAGANSGSLYYYFKSKEDLLLAVLETYKEMLWPVLLEPIFSKVSDPVERVFALLDGYRRGLEYTACTAGCPIGNLALDPTDARVLYFATFGGAVYQSTDGGKTRQQWVSHGKIVDGK